MIKSSEVKRIKPAGKATKEQLAELKALAEMPDDQTCSTSRKSPTSAALKWASFIVP